MKKTEKNMFGKRIVKKSRKISSPGDVEGADSPFALSNIPINLDLPGIYFVEAWHQYESGCRHHKELLKAIKKHDSLVQSVLARTKDISDAEVRLVWSLREMEVLYEPVVKSLALATILLAGAAEAYVNEVIAVLLPGGLAKEFDKLTLLGKWILLPKCTVLKRKVKWTLGSEPLQGLGELVATRNRLVHFRGRGQEVGTYLTPKFIEELNLVPEAIGRSFKAVKSAMQQFSLAWTGSYGPDWLGVDLRKVRRPCFYSGTRELAMVLWSGHVDKGKPWDPHSPGKK